jgi:MYND finger
MAEAEARTDGGSPGGEAGYYEPAYGKCGEPVIEAPDKVCGSGLWKCEKSRAAHGSPKKRHCKTCGRCRVFYYCDQECQKYDWTTGFHSKFCEGQPDHDAKVIDPVPSIWLATGRAEGSLFSDAERRKDCVAVIVQPVPNARVEETMDKHGKSFPQFLIRESLRELREGDLPADLFQKFPPAGLHQDPFEEVNDSKSLRLWNHFVSKRLADPQLMTGERLRRDDDVGTATAFCVQQDDDWRANPGKELKFNAMGSAANLVTYEKHASVMGPLLVTKMRFVDGDGVEELEPFAFAELLDVIFWRVHCWQRQTYPRRVLAGRILGELNQYFARQRLALAMRSLGLTPS